MLEKARQGVPLVRVYYCTLCRRRHEEGATLFYVKHLGWQGKDGINLEVKR